MRGGTRGLGISVGFVEKIFSPLWILYITPRRRDLDHRQVVQPRCEGCMFKLTPGSVFAQKAGPGQEKLRN